MNSACDDDPQGTEQGGHPDGGRGPTDAGDGLVDRLRLMADSVAGMEACLGTHRLNAGLAFADALVETATALLDDLDRTLDTDPAWDAELISTLRVYRNAGFMFRKLATDGRADPATEAVCATLIDQGHDHVGALLAEMSSPARPPSGPTSPRAAELADALDPDGMLRRRPPHAGAPSPPPGGSSEPDVVDP